MSERSALEMELVQCAAVIVAWIENRIYGHTDRGHGLATRLVLNSVRAERVRQDAKWGLGRHHSDEEWFAILAEEVSEAADEIDLSGLGIVDNYLRLVGEICREWIEEHEWPPRQQAIIDKERRGDGVA